LENTGLVARVYIHNEKGTQTKRAQTRKDKKVVKVQKRKVCEKELNQYESEIRRQCSRVGRVYQKKYQNGKEAYSMVKKNGREEKRVCL
jgi:hypothetical protein